MERNVAIDFAVKTLGMEVSKAKKMGTAQLIKKIEAWKVANPATVNVSKKCGRPANSNKVVRPAVKKGQFMIGWNTPDGNVRVLKYCSIKRQNDVCQTIVDSALEPEKMKRVHVYKKESTAVKQIEMMKNINSEMYAGLEILYK